MTFLWKEDKGTDNDESKDDRNPSPFTVYAIGEYDGATDELTLHNPPDDDDGVDA